MHAGIDGRDALPLSTSKGILIQWRSAADWLGDHSTCAADTQRCRSPVPRADARFVRKLDRCVTHSYSGARSRDQCAGNAAIDVAAAIAGRECRSGFERFADPNYDPATTGGSTRGRL